MAETSRSFVERVLECSPVLPPPSRMWFLRARLGLARGQHLGVTITINGNPYRESTSAFGIHAIDVSMSLAEIRDVGSGISRDLDCCGNVLRVIVRDGPALETMRLEKILLTSEHLAVEGELMLVAGPDGHPALYLAAHDLAVVR